MVATFGIFYLLRNLILCAILSAFCSIAIAQDTERLEVVAHPSVREQTTSRGMLQAIFAMRVRHWPDGTAIKVFVLNDEHPLHTVFCKEILNIYPHQLRIVWDRLVLSGTGDAPFQVSSEQDMLAKITITPGAIGYLRRSLITDDVQVLQIK